MKISSPGKPSTFTLVVAFAAIYIIWGSTYFFIKVAVKGIPPMILGSLRFLSAGILLLTWNFIKGERLWKTKDVATSAVTGLLLLFVSTGIIMWVERTLPSVVVAIMVSANPIWFVLLDRPSWKSNISSKTTMLGLLLGFGGVILLFAEAISKTLTVQAGHSQIISVIILAGAPIAWVAGSIFSKRRKSTSSASVSTSWQMIIAGLAFLPASLLHHEMTDFHFRNVQSQSWFALVYLVLFGSIAAFSAYIWLLKVRPATQVSTHSYVNPVVAVGLGVLFAHETITWVQISGLAIILLSVLLVNISKYNIREKPAQPMPCSLIKAA